MGGPPLTSISLKAPISLFSVFWSGKQVAIQAGIIKGRFCEKYIILKLFCQTKKDPLTGHTNVDGSIEGLISRSTL